MKNYLKIDSLQTNVSARLGPYLSTELAVECHGIYEFSHVYVQKCADVLNMKGETTGKYLRRIGMVFEEKYTTLINGVARSSLSEHVDRALSELTSVLKSPTGISPIDTVKVNKGFTIYTAIRTALGVDLSRFSGFSRPFQKLIFSEETLKEATESQKEKLDFLTDEFLAVVGSYSEIEISTAVSRREDTGAATNPKEYATALSDQIETRLSKSFANAKANLVLTP